MTSNKGLILERIFRTLLFVILLLTIIVNSGYALATVENEIGTIFLMFIAGIFFLGYIYIILKNKRISYYELYFWGYIAVLTVITLFNYENGDLAWWIKMTSCLFLAFFITYKIPFLKFASWFNTFMLIVTLISFVGLGLSIAGILDEMLPIVKNINDVFYRNGLLYFEIVNTNNLRNCAIFWEPGIYASFLNIALLVELYFFSGKRYWHIIIFSLGIFSAMSTAGWMLFCLIIVLFIYKKMESRLKYLYVILLLVTMALAVSMYDNILEILLNINYDFFSKFILDNASSVTRMMSPFYNIAIFLHSPIWGNGYVRASVMYEMMLHGNIVAQTSTTTQMMSVYGILGIIPHLLSIGGVFSLRSLSGFEKILISGIILIILNKEPHIFILSTYIFLMYLIGIFLNQKKGGFTNEMEQ